MSYNISYWKTKKLENLIIPLKAFYIHERKDWHPNQPKVLSTDEMGIKVSVDCADGHIVAFLKDGNLHVKEIIVYGEGSGTFVSWILNPALEQSSGELEAVLIWEGGDSITKFEVKDGVAKQEDIEFKL